MSAEWTLTDWLQVSRGGELWIRFRLPAEAAYESSPVGGTSIGVFLSSGIRASPDLLLTIAEAERFGGDPRGALRRQRLAARAYSRRRLEQCKSRKVAASRVGYVEILDQRTRQIDVTYIRIIRDSAIICGYRARRDTADQATLDQVARGIISSVQLRSKRAKRDLASERRVKFPLNGFSLELPQDWERQDLFGMIIVFGPGSGFRPRITIDRAYDDDGEDWESPTEPLEVYRMIYKGLCRRPKFDRPRRIQVAGQSGWRMEFRGVMNRNQIEIASTVVALPYKERGVVAQYLAAASDYRRYLSVFDRLLESITWLK
jgi:hypothetical protein